MELYRDVATGFNRWWHKISGQEEAGFYFWSFIRGLELLVAAWESGIRVFSIEQMNQRKTTRPQAQSIYQRMGGPWGRIRKYWPKVVVVNQPLEATFTYEWMEHLMPRNMGVVRPDRFLAAEDYMTFKHKVWENQLAARGSDPISGLVYEEDCGSSTRVARVATLCIRRGSPASLTLPPPVFPSSSRTPARL
jgi:hypothetical protein